MIKEKAKESNFIYLRPGANVFKQANDSVQIAFPNYTVTFQTPDIVALVIEIVHILPGESNVANIVKLVTKKMNVEDGFVQFIIDHLVTNNCAYYSGKKLHNGNESDLSNFYKYIFDKTDTVEKLKKVRVVLLTPEDKVETCKNIFNSGGILPKIVPATPGMDIKSYKEQILEKLDEHDMVMAAWNFPYRQPTANMINSLCVEKKLPVIFGGCEGIIGRIGPYIMPRNSSCLECMHLRLFCNFDENESRSYAEFRVLEENNIAASWVSHPGFHDAILQFFALELNRIMLGLTSNCLGSFYESSFGQIGFSKHLVIKVPNCPVCNNGKPSRFAWDFNFPAPVVKNSM